MKGNSALPLAVLPAPPPAVEERYQRALTQLSRKIIVLDDDPTGVQTVHDVIVSTSWSQECVLKCFRTGPPSALS